MAKNPELLQEIGLQWTDDGETLNNLTPEAFCKLTPEEKKLLGISDRKIFVEEIDEAKI